LILVYGKENYHKLRDLVMGEKEFPEIQGGGSLILAWQIRNKRVLVVGGGEANISNNAVAIGTDCSIGGFR
jgi:precorrin-2 dehydrogenase/sirohydrochlorin ferrochelatase